MNEKSINGVSTDLLEMLKLQSQARQAILVQPSGQPNQNTLNQQFGVKPVSFTKYSVKPTDSFYVRFGIVENEGRWNVVSEKEALADKTVEKHFVKFKMWNFGEELDWKNKSTDYDMMKKVHTLNIDKYNELKVRNLLLEWSFSDYDPQMKIFHLNGILSDESLKLFFDMYPTIVRHVLSRMNEILEFNG